MMQKDAGVGAFKHPSRPDTQKGGSVSMAMSLTGTFDALDFAEVLELLARRSCTGRLSIRAGSVHATVHLDDGSAVGVEVSGTGWRDPGRNWRTSLEEVCFQILRSGRGSFEFQPAERRDTPVNGSIKLTEVVAAAQKRLSLWREVESVIPSMSVVPQLSEGLITDSMTVNQEQWRVICALDGRRTVAAVARRLDMDQLSLAQILKPLVEDGALALVGPESLPRSALIRPESVDVIPGEDGSADAPIRFDAIESESDSEVEGSEPGSRRSPLVIPAYRIRTRRAGMAAGTAPVT
jgi:Domain of unknown function (DUF4388)